MARKRFYVCDGAVPGCRRSYCLFNGTGECAHTEDKAHARYAPPREWDVSDVRGTVVMREKLRT